MQPAQGFLLPAGLAKHRRCCFRRKGRLSHNRKDYSLLLHLCCLLFPLTTVTGEAVDTRDPAACTPPGGGRGSWTAAPSSGAEGSRSCAACGAAQSKPGMGGSLGWPELRRLWGSVPQLSATLLRRLSPHNCPPSSSPSIPAFHLTCGSAPVCFLPHKSAPSNWSLLSPFLRVRRI